MQKFYLLQDHHFIEVPTAVKGCWIHISEATEEDLIFIESLTGIYTGDLKDSLDLYEMPRIEAINPNVIVYSRHPCESERGLYTLTFTLVLSPSYTVTISPDNPGFIMDFILAKTLELSDDKYSLIIHILRKIAREFTNKIKWVRSHVHSQDKPLSDIDSDDIFSLTRYEEILNQYYSALHSLIKMIDELRSGKFITVQNEDDRDHLDDLYFSVVQSHELCSINLKSISNSRNAQQIIFANNLTKTIKLLTSLTIILSIPTMIASLYGMNVNLPISQNPHAFVYIILITACSLLISFWYFKRRKWL